MTDRNICSKCGACGYRYDGSCPHCDDVPPVPHDVFAKPNTGCRCRLTLDTQLPVFCDSCGAEGCSQCTHKRGGRLLLCPACSETARRLREN